MSQRPLGLVLSCLRRVAGGESGGESTDRQLLGRFVEHRDEAAFTALVQRHGPMVLGVCRRALADTPDAEDAFQATFLVLVRRAASLAWHDSLGGWLHQVAVRVAQRARAVRSRRRAVEREVGDMPSSDDRAPEADSHELRRLLDEELERLPSRYRVPLVLCYLEGKSHEEAAQELGCPRGSMARLLDRARDLLRDRLTGRGLALPAGVAALLTAEQAASASLPAPLMETTIRTAAKFAAGDLSGPAAQLAEGVIRAMVLSKMKRMIAGLAVVAMLAGGLGWLWSQQPPAAPLAPAKASVAEPKLRLEVKAPGRPVPVGEDITLEITLSTATEEDFEFRLGSFPQAFGIYVLGPWGHVLPDPAKVRPENWMHQQHSAARRILLDNERPFTTTVKLSEFFPVTDSKQFKPGTYQVNVKFYDAGLAMAAPIDSGPVRFEVAGDPGKPAQPGATKKLDAPDVTPAGIEKRLRDIVAAKDANSELQVLVLEAAMMLAEDKVRLQERFQAPARDQDAENQFKSNLENIQKNISLQQFRLSVILDELSTKQADRGREPPVWQARYDYLLVRLQARVAQIYEYNAMLGGMRKEFPERDPKVHEGWQLVPHGTMSDRDALKDAQKASKVLQRMIKDHAGTEWEEIAKAEAKIVESGWKWEAYPKKP